MVDLGDEEKAEWVRSRELLNQQIHNYVHILVIDEVASDLTKAILDLPAGRFEGGSKQGGRAKFVGVVWDSRVMGGVLGAAIHPDAPAANCGRSPAFGKHPCAPCTGSL